MNEELLASIEELGLSQKEARVYLANLMIGPAAVQKIADHSGIKRVTTYVILEALVNLGLVSQSTKGKKTVFTAEDPISLRRLLDKKQQQIKEQKEHFEGVLPELQELKGLPAETPNVKFYDSAEGIKSVFKTFLISQKSAKVTYGISNIDQVYAFFPEFRANLTNPSRAQSGIKSRFIYTSAEGPILKSSDRQRNRDSRWLPVDKYPLHGDINIVGDHIVMLSLTGTRPLGVSIRSAELAKSLLALFELVWDASEKYNRK